MAWGVVEGRWRASGPRDHCEAASAAASRLPPAAMPPIACRPPPVPLDTACDLLGLPDRPPPRLCACVPIADRRPPTADRRAPPAASDLPARRPACVPACLPAARRRGRWSLRGLCWVPRMDGGGDGGLGWCARRRPRVWWGTGVGAGASSVVSGTGLVSACGGWGEPQPLSRSDPLSERLFHIACSPFVVASVSGTLTSHTRGRGECASMP